MQAHPARSDPQPSFPIDAEPLPVPTAVRLFRPARPSRRPRFVAALLVAATMLVLLLTSHAGAQDESSQQIAARQFLGAASREGVVVRSGPSQGDFGAVALDRGRQVVVVGSSGEFLRILPPEGAFCLVPKADVNVRGDAGGDRIGRVTDKCSVRVGSAINQVIGATVGRLDVGDEVQVVGEDGQYYHVTPPKGTFFYVGRDDLERVREVQVTATARGWKVGELPAAAALTVTPAADPAPRVTQTPAIDPPAEVEPTPVADAAPMLPGDDDGVAGTADATEATEATSAQPAAPEAVADATPAEPSTRPSLVEAFRALDQRYVDAAAGPLEGQPLADLHAEYQRMLAATETDAAGAAIKPVIEARLKTIEVRQAALDDLQAIQTMRQEMVQRQRALEAEQQELAERAEKAAVTMYAAVGQVQPSSLQIGGEGVLYRLCDPATGRTLIYLRAEGKEASDLTKAMQKFVGVKGEVVTDGDLEMKYVKVTRIDLVKPDALFDTIAAELIPPSLVQKQAAAE